ncbi:Cytochrome P450, family 76, subfamily C, polypeptide 6 [Heracleum sosnowskyi]|uniref:Cytochrome P450, family 76, subfamily C, polypeptide 6 n=1 Tax=Heracleum sosnowskyi TaxID=360622 RepID=A0AAD8I879_9APIA|nr:Cytochrome P450, family 76, subfamily C, polypeptide 6 [Heracleum sosnowskyi]
MEWIWNYIFCSVLICLVSILWHLKSIGYNSKLPPGPRGWPIFGNIFDLGNLPHRSLAALKPKYGPVVWTNLGSVKTMTVLSAAAAEELFKNHDLSFINRTIVETMRSHDFCKCSTGSVPYGDYWRTLRRICAVELFTTKKLNETKLIRQKCVDNMVLWIEKEIKEHGSTGFELTHFVFPALYNMMGNILISRDLVDPHSKIASEFYMAMAGFLECMGRPNVSDIFPWLRWLDLQGLRKRMNHDLGKTIEITSGFVADRVKQRKKNAGKLSERKDFLDVLLDSKDEPVKLTDHQIIIFLLEMFFGGTETFSATIEWAMSELLQNPEAMIKIKAELARVIGTSRPNSSWDLGVRQHVPLTYIAGTSRIS